MAEKKITRRLSIFINGKEIKNSLGAIGREIYKVKKKLKEATDPADIKKYQKELKNLEEAFSEVDREINGVNAVLREARGHWDNFTAGLLSGNFELASKGLRGILTNIKAITKAAWTFITTPIGAALAVLAAAGAGLKAWVNYNLEIEKTNTLVKDLTQQSGTAVDAIRIRAEGLQKTFKVDINESISAAKSLVKGFGISYDKAFDIVEDSAIRGKLKNKEFLESLREYPTQFQNAGFSAQEFVDVVNAGYDLDIYTDKLPDAIKEFGLALTEQTDAAKEALTNAFGPNFTNKLLRDVKKGAITTKDALALISKEAKRIGLNSQQAQQLTADLFKGAGEDAGGALKVFQAVNVALNEQKKPLTEVQEIQKEQIETNKELNGIYSQLFASGSKGFNMWIQKGKLFATKTIIKILKKGVGLYNWFVDLNNQSGLFSAILVGIGEVAVAPFKILGALVKGAWNSFKGLGNMIAGIFTLDWDRFKSGLNQGFSGISDSIRELAGEAKESVDNIFDAFNGKHKIKKISLKDFVSDDAPEMPDVAPVANNRATAKQIEDAKKLLAKKRELFERSEQELNKIIEKIQQQRLLNTKKGIEKELFAIDQKYDSLIEKFVLSEEEKTILTLEQIEARENKIKELEDAKEREKHELKKLREAEFKAELDAIKEENRLLEEEARFEREAEAARSDEERQLILLEKARYIANEQLKIERDAELAKVKEVEGAEKLKAAIRKKYQLKKAKVDAEFFTAEKALKSDVVQWTKLTEEQKLDTIKGALNGAAEAFNKGSVAWKATKIAETTITTYQSAMNAYNALAGIPVVGPALGAAAAAAAVVSGLKQVQRIGSTRLQKMPKHYYGGFTGDKAIYNDEYGKVTGVVHDGEWVAPKFMRQSPRYAPTINWLEKQRKKELGQFFDGGDTSPSTDLDIGDDDFDDNRPDIMALLLLEISRLNEALEKGIISKTYIGDDEIQRQKDREERLDQTRENAKIK
jgi:hypothetical protein